MIYKVQKSFVLEWPGNRIELRKGDILSDGSVWPPESKSLHRAGESRLILVDDEGIRQAKKVKGLVIQIKNANNKLPD